MNLSMHFDAISEDIAGEKWLTRWNRSWPAYRHWFLGRKGDQGPSRLACEEALIEHMPELVPIWKSLCELTGDDDLAARFLSTWCPPAYLGGCSLAAMSNGDETRLVRNYDLSPTLNEGLLMRTQWSGTPVMGMIEFLWGLSDGVNQHGLAVALAFGGSSQVGKGFGITTILRYVLQTCANVEQALIVLQRVPSHMAYNITMADSSGQRASVELSAGGGMNVVSEPIASNHQTGSRAPDNAVFTQTFERLEHLGNVLDSTIKPSALAAEFLKPPLYQHKYSASLGTLFTAEYDPVARSLNLIWPDARWSQSLQNFTAQTQQIHFDAKPRTSSAAPDAQKAKPYRFEAKPYAHGAQAKKCGTHADACDTRPNSEPLLPIDDTPHWLDYLACIEQHVDKKTDFRVWMKAAKAGDVNWSEFSTLFDPDYR